MRILKIGSLFLLALIIFWGCKQHYTILDGVSGGKFTPKSTVNTDNKSGNNAVNSKDAKIEENSNASLNSNNYSEQKIKDLANSQSSGKLQGSLKFKLAKKIFLHKFRPNKRNVDSLHVYKSNGRESNPVSTTGITLFVVGLIVFLISLITVYSTTVAATSVASAETGCLTILFGYAGMAVGLILALVGLILWIVDAAS